MTERGLSKARVYELREGRLTSNIFSFQYYPVIRNPIFGFFEEELKRRMKLAATRRIWVYHHNAESNTLYLVNNDNFRHFLAHGFIRVFVETERQLMDEELRLEFPKLANLESFDDVVSKDKSGDKEALLLYTTELKSIYEGLMAGINIDKRKGGPVGAQALPICGKCGERVGPIWFMDSRYFEPVCSKDRDKIVSNNNRLAKSYILIQENAVFKYEKQFLELRAEFRDIPDEEIKYSLYAHKGDVKTVASEFRKEEKSRRR